MRKNVRNEKGQFINGTKYETVEQKTKRILALRESAKNSPKYLGELKYSKLYNVWRSFMFTKKGQNIGCSDEWKSYKKFYEDMADTHIDGYRLGRLDKNKQFSKENCMWLSEKEMASLRSDALKLEYNGEIKTLREWSIMYQIPMNGIVQRFQKQDKYSAEEIIFGKLKKKQNKITDIKELSIQKQRNKVSKMISAYKCSDKKRGKICNYTKDWIIENIVTKKCIYCGSNKNVGCDRINNNFGHTIDNTVPACYICNTVRSNLFTVDEMKLLGKVIEQITKNRII